MQTDALFRNERRDAISHHSTQIGLDYIEVDPTLKVLKLYFMPAAQGIVKRVIPESITDANVRITGGIGVTDTNVRVTRVSPAPDDPLELQIGYDQIAVQGVSDFPTYTLELINVPNLDPFFAKVAFSLRVEELADFDPSAGALPAPKLPPEIDIDYLARDYSSFRRLMLDRLSLLMARWTERHTADLGTTLVEVLAYVADHLSYYQDAVATEAYLGTARRRTSVRRHARLLDYTMHEGCNARVWVHVQVDADNVVLNRGTSLLTRTGAETRIAPNSSAYTQALAAGPQVFETVHSTVLFKAHNEIAFYTWGARDYALPEGATAATLRDEWINPADQEAGGKLATLQVGDVLIFEEVKDPITGLPADADPSHRHVVRLTRVTPSVDPLGRPSRAASGRVAAQHFEAVPVVEIEWSLADALPFPLRVAALSGGQHVEHISVARGNLVLADHGRTQPCEALPAVPDTGAYRPQLQRAGLTYSVPYDDILARQQPAAAVMVQDPRAAVPVVTLRNNDTEHGHQGAEWAPRRDLLNSDRFAYEFVVEMENDGRATLRFGDGMRGRQPAAGTHLQASYRVGNGPGGNVGPEAIVHVVTTDEHISSVRNPLAAQGGCEPESIEQVRLVAPWGFHTQERYVTEADYKAVAERHPDVQQAAAMQIPGVVQADIDRFQRWGRPPQRELETGQIAIGLLEIARLDNDPAAPEHGKIEFIVKGGR